MNPSAPLRSVGFRQQRTFLVVFTGVIVFLFLSSVAWAHPDRCIIVRVIDGDTVRIRCPDPFPVAPAVIQEKTPENEATVRLLRINTPERGRRGYAEATEAMRALVENQKITWVAEDSPEWDKYGRLLAYLFASGRNLNVEMVRQGWSRFWTRYGEGRYAQTFRQAEREARSQHLGLWAE